MNPAQRKLFKDANCYKVDLEGENAKHWQELIRVTASRKTMTDYLTDFCGRSYDYTYYPYVWNVKAYPDLDLDDFREWLKTSEDHSFETEDAEKRGFIEKAYEACKDDLFQWGLESAASSVLRDDVHRCTRFSDEMHKWEGGFVGRSGGYFTFTQVRGVSLPGRYKYEVEEDLTDTFEEMDRLELFKWCMLFVEMDICMTSKAAEDEVQYQAFWQLARRIEDMYEDNMVGRWEVIEVDKPKGYYRVRNTVTEEESMLGTKEECQEIVRLAEAGELLGSFGLKKR
jgi:hypothetical protein